MSRTHIHSYETRYHAKATYSKAIRARGDIVVMQGQVGTLLDGTVIGPGGSTHPAAAAALRGVDPPRAHSLISDWAYRICKDKQNNITTSQPIYTNTPKRFSHSVNPCAILSTPEQLFN